MTLPNVTIDPTLIRSEMLTAIQRELEENKKHLEFRVESSHREKDLIIIKVGFNDSKLYGSGLDETLEGATAWWPEPERGAADVLSVIPELQQINLRYASSSPPIKGQKLFLYPPNYLEPLRDAWSNYAWANRCIDWYQTIHARNAYDKLRAVSTTKFQQCLRTQQRMAFELPGWNTSFLWGPPGTGKTYTLGRLLAQYLVQCPKSRVLLLATTNSAVDHALISVDQGLEVLGQHSLSSRKIRSRCCRIGNHFIAKHYSARQHLLPIQDEVLLRQLTTLEAARPDPSNVHQYAAWKTKIELVRKAIRQQAADLLAQSRLAAMTTTRAVFTLTELQERAPYDLVVFDEASQVGLAHALAIVPLARRLLFAGDPKQLAPIVKSDHPASQKWMGQSIFSSMLEESSSTCMLTEQSRMAESICRVVSTLFYNKKLVVATECLQSKAWLKERQLAFVPCLEENHVHVESVNEDGTWSQKYHGPIRHCSAVQIQEIVSLLIERGTSESEILVLTPFRAQRTLIRQFLRTAGFRNTIVSTVHRAQGSEQHTVIFDPVDGTNAFFQAQMTSRLVNVALSRAKARLVVMLSPKDRTNALLRDIADVIGVMRQPIGPTPKAVPIQNLVRNPDFPKCALQRVVQIKNRIGKVIEVSAAGDRFYVLDSQDGARCKYLTALVKKNFG